LSAFFWATIFHGLQYLVIVAIFHVKDQSDLPNNERGALYHAAHFYLFSLALGYGLFYCWPYAFVLVGFGLAESVLLVAAAINIHHFIVDAHIWRMSFWFRWQPVLDCHLNQKLSVNTDPMARHILS